MKLSVFQMSRIGGRSRNEDRMGYRQGQDTALLLVADGLGGHSEGELAAQMAVQCMSSLFEQQDKTRPINPTDFLRTALLAAHAHIIRYARDQGMQDAPRTTLVAAMVQGDQASWVHCGDSRLYWVREGSLRLRTLDHSYQEQRSKQVPMSPAGLPASRHALFSCLGSPAAPVFDLGGPVTLQPGDRLLLCSDGLWGSVPDSEIVKELARSPVSQAVPELVEKALLRAGEKSDNVTAVALHCELPDNGPDIGQDTGSSDRG
jgi:serine/threonine protein phosphatase PrpC